MLSSPGFFLCVFAFHKAEGAGLCAGDRQEEGQAGERFECSRGPGPNETTLAHKTRRPTMKAELWRTTRKRTAELRKTGLFEITTRPIKRYTGSSGQDATLPLLRVPEGYAWPTFLQISARR